jgi:hypothetical protein
MIVPLFHGDGPDSKVKDSQPSYPTIRDCPAQSPFLNCGLRIWDFGFEGFLFQSAFRSPLTSFVQTDSRIGDSRLGGFFFNPQSAIRNWQALAFRSLLVYDLQKKEERGAQWKPKTWWKSISSSVMGPAPGVPCQ